MRITKIHLLLLVPLIILVGVGILSRSVREVSPFVACTTNDYSGLLEPGATFASYHGEEFVLPDTLLAQNVENFPVLGVAEPSERYIEVDLSEQKLWAWDGDKLFLESLVSTGLPWWPTPTGEFRVWVKLRATRMEGGEGRYYYNLPNVPYVMYFENEDLPGWRGYGLHGAYWHNDFGATHSHGCVNLPVEVAEKLYFWATPDLPAQSSSVFASNENPGTRIIIHQ